MMVRDAKIITGRRRRKLLKPAFFIFIILTLNIPKFVQDVTYKDENLTSVSPDGDEVAYGEGYALDKFHCKNPWGRPFTNPSAISIDPEHDYIGYCTIDDAKGEVPEK